MERARSRGDRGSRPGGARGAPAGLGAYLVGGAARSLVSGRDPRPRRRHRGRSRPRSAPRRARGRRAEPRRHERFGTATVPLPGGRHADLARTRTETYASPGALPTVEPAPIEDDLARRDFTVNAIAIAIDPPHCVVDPFSGAADLEAGTLRALHAGLVPRRPDPRDPRRPGTAPGSASTPDDGHARRCSRGPTSARSRPTAAGRARAGSPPRTRPRPASRSSPSWGADRPPDRRIWS